jgi:hypothetical protein
VRGPRSIDALRLSPVLPARFGERRALFDTSTLASGDYVVRLNTGAEVLTRRVVVAR